MMVEDTEVVEVEETFHYAFEFLNVTRCCSVEWWNSDESLIFAAAFKRAFGHLNPYMKEDERAH